MKIENLEKMYKANKELDDKFDIIYADVKNLDDCNKIELMAELMELANSSRVFKYWKKKPMDYEETLYEYADWLTMLFYFFNTRNKKIDIQQVDKEINIIDLFLKLINLYHNFSHNKTYRLNISFKLSYFSFKNLLYKFINFRNKSIILISLSTCCISIFLLRVLKK